MVRFTDLAPIECKRNSVCSLLCSSKYEHLFFKLEFNVKTIQILTACAIIFTMKLEYFLCMLTTHAHYTCSLYMLTTHAHCNIVV